MSAHPNRGQSVRRRIRHVGGQHQLAVVAGYSWKPHTLQVYIYLACGTMPSGLLRYSGKTILQFSSEAERRAFARRVQAIRLPRRHPLLASPLPLRMVPVAPRLLAVVTHHGWSEGGLMHGIEIEGFRSVEDASDAKREGPTIFGQH